MTQLLQMDAKTIFQLYFWGNLFICLLIASFYYSYAVNENKQALKWFGQSKTLLTIGWALIFLRGIIPDLLSINLANTIIFGACYLESIALLNMLKNASKKAYRIEIYLTIFSILLFNVITFLGAGYHVRTLVVSILIPTIFLTPTVKFLIERNRNFFRTLYAASYIVFYVMIVLRGVHVFTNPSSGLLTTDTFDSVYYLSLFLLTLIGIVGFLLLIKEKQDQRIQNLLKDKDQFFSIIAHDLRGPLGSAVGISEILAENASDYGSEEIQNIAKMLHEANKNSFKLLENLLEWSQVQTGLIEFKPQKIDLQSLIRENIELNKQAALNKSILLDYTYNDDLELFADKNMINTVIRNLLVNAIKFTERNGCVIIETKKYDRSVEISVKDTGVGMDEKTRDKLFKINEKVSNKGTENETGTGLGLLLCNEFVEKHNGRIWAESELGKGSTFKFILPLN